MDSLLYDDLLDPFFPVAVPEEEEKKDEKDIAIQQSEEELEKMKVKVSELSEQNSALKKNISCLFKTAKLELGRKSATITSLQKRIDILQAVISHAVNNKPSPANPTPINTQSPPVHPSLPANNIPPVTTVTVAMENKPELKSNTRCGGQRSEGLGQRNPKVSKERFSKRRDPMSQRIVDDRRERERRRRGREEKENTPKMVSSVHQTTKQASTKPLPPPPPPPPPPPTSLQSVDSHAKEVTAIEITVIDSGEQTVDIVPSEEEKKDGVKKTITTVDPAVEQQQRESDDIEQSNDDTESIPELNIITSSNNASSEPIPQSSPLIQLEREATPPPSPIILASSMTLTEEDVIDVQLEKEEGEIDSCDDIMDMLTNPCSLDFRPPTPTSSPYKKTPSSGELRGPMKPCSQSKGRLDEKERSRRSNTRELVEERSRRSNRKIIRDLADDERSRRSIRRDLDLRDRDLRRRGHSSSSLRQQRDRSPISQRRPCPPPNSRRHSSHHRYH